MKFYSLLSAIFSVVVITSNIISAKMVSLPIFQNFAFPAGLITYPLTFFLSDFVTEIFGARKAKEMVYQALGLSVLASLIIQAALFLPGATPENHRHFDEVLGLNGVLVFASLTAYVFCQMTDIRLYAFIKQWTGERHLWLRSNGSTLIAQLIDTAIVNLIYLKLGAKMPLPFVFAVMLFSYIYKCTFSLALTPLFYLCVRLFKRFKTA
jgi:uncharacterized integral membrane protein (TIGR00697 family)